MCICFVLHIFRWFKGKMTTSCKNLRSWDGIFMPLALGLGFFAMILIFDAYDLGRCEQRMEMFGPQPWYTITCVGGWQQRRHGVLVLAWALILLLANLLLVFIICAKLCFGDHERLGRRLWKVTVFVVTCITAFLVVAASIVGSIPVLAFDVILNGATECTDLSIMEQGGFCMADKLVSVIMGLILSWVFATLLLTSGIVQLRAKPKEEKTAKKSARAKQKTRKQPTAVVSV